jgi:microcystin-dependent protein
MAGPYDIYPAVDAGYNFPPEIRTALLASSDVTAALNKARDDGAKIAAAALTGLVSAFAGSAAPNGWLLCDGTAVSRTIYASLFNAIGTTYGGGDGSTTFNLPNLKGRIPVGYDSAQTEFAALGQTGGEKAHVQTVQEMAVHTHAQTAHSHTGGTSQNGYHSHGDWTSGVGDHSHTGYTDNQGTHSHGGGTGYSGDHAHGSSTLDGFMTYQTTNATRNLFQRNTAATAAYVINSTNQASIGYGSTNTAGGHTHGIGNDGGHTHNIQTYNAGGHNHQIYADGNHTHSFTTDGTTASNVNNGGSSPANVLQPYVAMNYIIHV